METSQNTSEQFIPPDSTRTIGSAAAKGYGFKLIEVVDFTSISPEEAAVYVEAKRQEYIHDFVVSASPLSEAEREVVIDRARQRFNRDIASFVNSVR